MHELTLGQCFAGGQEFTISGWGFPENAEVLIGGQICSRNSWTETDINCIVPASSVTVHIYFCA